MIDPRGADRCPGPDSGVPGTAATTHRRHTRRRYLGYGSRSSAERISASTFSRATPVMLR